MTEAQLNELYQLYPMPFGDQGAGGIDLVEIPDYAKSDVSMTMGYTGEYSDFANKRFPKRGEFNWLLHLVTQMYDYCQHGGILTYEPEISNLIGGYPKNAVLAYTDGTTFCYATSCKDNNMDNFVENPSFLDGKSWRVRETKIFPDYAKMQNAKMTGDGSWVAPDKCWVYTSCTAFLDCRLYVNDIFVAEVRDTPGNPRHGTTGWHQQFLASKGDTFRFKLGAGSSIQTGKSGANGFESVNLDMSCIMIRYCPLRA